MSRIVSVWLPRWPILRFLATQARSVGTPVDPDRPFVLTVEAAGGPRIAALNAAAEAYGLAAGDLVADARAKADGLQVRDIEPAADDAALRKLALWATRYTPAVAPFDTDDGADGIFLDIAGAAHLFGGEEMLLADLSARLARFGLPARLAVADTPGAAWALSHYHAARAFVLPSGAEESALAPLPVEALRLTPQTRATLRRLGFKRVGMLAGEPRAPFAARFERELLRRLDQACGRASEPLAMLSPPPVYHSLRYLAEPILTQDAIIAVATRLMRDLVHALDRDGAGARALRLSLYRVDGAAAAIEIGLALPTRDVAHVTRLIALKLDRLAEAIDAGFGIEALGLAVTVAEPIDPDQGDFATADERADAQRCAALTDRLGQRLGPRAVRQMKPVASHIPERAEEACAVEDAQPWPEPDAATPRPLLLLPRAEPAEVMALVPEGPPRRFLWRGMAHAVAFAQGPERIASEWWRAPAGAPASAPTRDYYLVEDEAGRRFWLFREGLYGRETATPRWFVHGLFA